MRWSDRSSPTARSHCPSFTLLANTALMSLLLVLLLFITKTRWVGVSVSLRRGSSVSRTWNSRVICRSWSMNIRKSLGTRFPCRSAASTLFPTWSSSSGLVLPSARITMDEPRKQPPDLAATEFSVRSYHLLEFRNTFNKNYKLVQLADYHKMACDQNKVYTKCSQTMFNSKSVCMCSNCAYLKGAGIEWWMPYESCQQSWYWEYRKKLSTWWKLQMEARR